MRDEIENEVLSVISDVCGFDEEEVSPDSNFFEDLDVDSIKAIEITVALEKKFKVSIRDEDVPNLKTVRQAVEMLESLLAGRSTA